MSQQVAQTPRAAAQRSAAQTNAEPREDADLHASSDEYARRFSTTVGQWMLQIQEESLLSLLSHTTESILDVGGGHAQTALPLHRAGKAVTVLGSSPACAGRLTPEIEAGSVSFKAGNLIQLPFGPRSFDTVVSFRLMSHCTAWKTLIAEMCRVAEHSVIFDYPIWCSTNVLTPLLFRIKKIIEGNTRTYTIFTTGEFVREFTGHGFTCTAMKKQFFFPMGLHRAISNPKASRFLEGVARSVGLTRLFGSPVVIRFERAQRDRE